MIVLDLSGHEEPEPERKAISRHLNKAVSEVITAVGSVLI
jgi:hypothetical protein